MYPAKQISNSNRLLPMIGVSLSVFGFLLGAISIGWQMWFVQQYVDLNITDVLIQDTVSYSKGLLTVPILAFAPMFGLTGLAMSFVSFVCGWRRLATFSIAVNSIGLIVYLVILYLVFR